MDINSCYHLLDLKPGVDERKVKRQARRLLLKFHPDVSSHDREYATRKTREIIYAYKRLMDDVRGDMEYHPTEQKQYRSTGGTSCSDKISRDETTYVRFILDGESLCIPAHLVREVLRLKDIPLTKLPGHTGEGSIIRGIGRWRDSNIPLVSPAKDAISVDTMVIVLEHNGRYVGLATEGVDGLFTAPGNACFAIDMIPTGQEAWVRRVVKRDGELIGILEIDSLI